MCDESNQSYLVFRKLQDDTLDTVRTFGHPFGLRFLSYDLYSHLKQHIVAAAKAQIGKTAAQPDCIKSCCADFACECAISRTPKSKQDKK